MTYAPKIFESESETPHSLVRAELEPLMEQYGIHTIYEGENKVGGHTTGEPAVVCVVEKKGMQAQKQLPPYLFVNGQKVLLDVIENPPPKDLRLWQNGHLVQAVTTHQKCHDCPVPGGVQIAPQNARWVGTLGAAIQLPEGYGFLTNEHVSGMGAVGTYCCQPHGQAGWIGRFTRTGGVRFDGPNFIDAAVADSLRSDGPFAPGTHTVVPMQLDLGRLKPEPMRASVGMKVIKSGRTTGVTRGRVVGVNGTSRVGYEEGAALFQRQVIVEADVGNFSAGGDSGSLILTEDLRPVCLLFAGGGGQTIANPIEFVLDWCGGTFF